MRIAIDKLHHEVYELTDEFKQTSIPVLEKEVYKLKKQHDRAIIRLEEKKDKLRDLKLAIDILEESMKTKEEKKND